MDDRIYLDNNATTALHPRVGSEMQRCVEQGYLNPASSHREGRRARQRLEDGRDRAAQLLGLSARGTRRDQLIFTSGGTEANNLALRGLVGPPPQRLVVSTIEHPSVLATAQWMQRQGYQVDWLRVDGSGRVSLEHLEQLLSPPPQLVSVMYANNETGVIQPLAEISRQCQAAGVPLHVDAVQAVGKLPLDFAELGASAMTLNAHKLHGPCGIGALAIRADTALQPLHLGGAQQLGLRPGTEPVVLVAGLETALELAVTELADRAARMARLRDALEDQLLDRLDALTIVGRDAPRLPHTSCLAFPGRDRQALLMALDFAGVACSTGSACASGSSEPSHVLQSMGLADELVEGAIRISLSAFTTQAEIELAADKISRAAAALGGC